MLIFQFAKKGCSKKFTKKTQQKSSTKTSENDQSSKIKKYRSLSVPSDPVLFCSKKSYDGHVISIILLSPTKNESRDLSMIF